jgi:hypothetical protein
MGECTQSRPSLASRDTEIFERLQHQIDEKVRQFRSRPITPLTFYEFEKSLKACFDSAGHAVLQQTLNELEPKDRTQAAPKIRYHKERYRINKRTPATIATIFGSLRLWSFLYLNEEDGEPGLHPLRVRLGVEAGATPLLAERVAHWAVDHSQSEVRQLLEAEHGVRWSNDHLRKVLGEFRRRVMPFRAKAQTELLLQALEQAEASRGRHRPVLAVGRDGVMTPMRSPGYQESSTATVSVYDRRRKRLCTVYLGQMPEPHQATLSEQLTELIQAVLGQYAGPQPRLVFVTDKGQAPDDYYMQVLQKLEDPRRPGRKLTWEWVLDFFHVTGYVSKLADILFGSGSKEGSRWFARMRHWLRHRRQGVSQILRSAMQLLGRRHVRKHDRPEFWRAYRYLRNHRRWMDYPGYLRQGLPIGSGVTEAACKTVFSQRLKRSGMRWHRESGQVIVDLRIVHLSGIWDKVVRRDLASRELSEEVQPGSARSFVGPTRRKAA